MRPENRIYHFVGLFLFVVLVRAGMILSPHVAWLYFLPIVAYLHGRIRRAKGRSRISPIAVPYAVAIVWLRGFLQYRLGIGKRASKHASQPRGFCPTCHYAMNPGRCPECGTEVSSTQLKRRIVADHRQHKRNIVLLAVLLIVGIGAPAIYHYFNWAGLLSNEMLLRLQAFQVRPAELELVRRYRDGGLSKPLKRQFFDQALHPSCDAIAVYPADVPFYVHVYLDMTIKELERGDRFFHRKHAVFVDGVESVEHAVALDAASVDPLRNHWILGGPALPVGEHDVTIAATVTMSASKDLELIDALAIHTTQFSVSTRVRIKDRPASDFVDAVRDAESVTAFSKTTRVHGGIPITAIRPPDPDAESNAWMFRRSIRIDRLGAHRIPIAGHIFIRPSGKGEFQKLGWIYLRDRDKKYWAIPETGALAGVDRVDIRIEPDATIAIQQVDPKDRRYCGETLNFDGIAIPTESMRR